MYSLNSWVFISELLFFSKEKYSFPKIISDFNSNSAIRLCCGVLVTPLSTSYNESLVGNQGSDFVFWYPDAPIDSTGDISAGETATGFSIRNDGNSRQFQVMLVYYSKEK